jgi:MoaA/NifB/PqqE/SkfB family radical SAM enzyme
MNCYKNGNYKVIIMDDGTKVRTTKEDDFIPSFAENVDVCITKKCNVGCKFCYEGCTPQGKHADLFKYEFLNTLHPYTEMALNGNDLDNPQFIDFLKFLKEKKVFANITVHQSQFINNYEKILELVASKLIYGIGISYNHFDESFIKKVKRLKNAVIHSINGIITEKDIEQLANNDLKLLILGYKDLRRGSEYKIDNKAMIEINQEYLSKNIKSIVDSSIFKVVSFDNLAIEQLNLNGLLTEKEWEDFYMGDDGTFTFYIDMVEGTFAKNSLSQYKFDIGSKSIDEMFNIIRNNK